jgi:hypothetical protein
LPWWYFANDALKEGSSWSGPCGVLVVAFQHPQRVEPRLCHDIFIACITVVYIVREIDMDTLIASDKFPCRPLHGIRHTMKCQRCHLHRYC